MPCLVAEDISGLVQRISDSTLISLQCVWSMLRHLQHSSVFVHVKRTLVSIETRNFLARKGLIFTHSQFLFYFGSPESSKIVAARIPMIYFCVVPINLFSGTGGRCIFFCELHCKYKLSKEF